MIANWKVAGLPALTVVGVAALAVSSFLEYTVLSSPALGGAITWTSIGSVVGVFVFGLLAYSAYYLYRKSQGIDLRLVFGEVPPA